MDRSHDKTTVDTAISRMGNLILNWPQLLQPFKTVFSSYINVYVFAM